MTSPSQPDSVPAVSLQDVSKFYGPVRAADRVAIDVYPGEFFTMLGASGSGKTTCLRLIAGFESADEGRLQIGGKDVTHVAPHKRNVHTVFQDYALFPHLSVFDNVAFPLALRRVPRRERKQKVAEVLDKVQLGAMSGRKPSQLSGGQQQRVALARAIVDRPDVLLLDEPLSALDAKIRGELREQLRMLQRTTGVTFVYVTHDQEEALTMSDRIAVMRGGKVLQVGPPIDIYEHPVDLFVAEFVGKANFVAGIVKSDHIEQGQVAVDIDGLTGQGTVAGDTPPPVGSKVRVMIRPENLRLIPPAEGDPLRGRILQANYLGHSTEYLIDSPIGRLRAMELRRRGALPYGEGAEVALDWQGDEAIVYPEPTA